MYREKRRVRRGGLLRDKDGPEKKFSSSSSFFGSQSLLYYTEESLEKCPLLG